MGRVLVRADKVLDVSGDADTRWDFGDAASADADGSTDVSARRRGPITVLIRNDGGDSDLWISLDNPRAGLWVEYLRSRRDFDAPVRLEADEVTREVSAVLPVHLYTVDGVVPASDGTGVEVIFRESPAVYFLHGTHERFDELQQILEREAASAARPKPRVLVTCQPTGRKIVDVEPLPTDAPSNGPVVGAAPSLRDTPPPAPAAHAPTPLTLSQALEAFDAVSAIGELNIPFVHPTDCCYQRAYLMCRLLRQRNIRSEKLWNYGSRYAHKKATLRFFTDSHLNSILFWTYHVAPVVSVPSFPGGSLVLDPAMFPDCPVPVETWLRAQNDPGSDSFRSSDMALWRMPVTHEERVEQVADEFLPEVLSGLGNHVRGWKESRLRLLLAEPETS